MRMGQVTGRTDSRGGHPEEKVYSVQRVLSTLCGRLGIDPSQSFLSPAGRKMSVTEGREPVKQLIGSVLGIRPMARFAPTIAPQARGPNK